MLKISYEYFVMFNKIVWSEKIPIINSLIVPGIFFFLSNYKWLVSSPNTDQMIPILNIYWAYIIISVYLNGVVLQLSSFRESGFLKTSAMISGGKSPIFIGLSMTEILFGFINILAFTIIVGLATRVNISILLISVVFLYITTSLPIVFFLSWIPSLSAKPNTLNSLLNIFLVILIVVATIRPGTKSFFIESLYSLIPTDYITQVAIFFENIVFKGSVKYFV
ncbi:hypothetical protein [Sporolactobacillus putidus]|uniref:hypothetical protein n=1 Tax=Sporolactobacillus putidus TaxID=492735 RepID=UPI001665BD0B|nr:hypothetical protein [Sporolactobacillus putidus]